MGGGQSKQYLSESELSNAESDSEWFLNSEKSVESRVKGSLVEEMPYNIEEESGERTDAALRNPLLPIPEQVITLEKVQDIEKELDDYEIVSMVYLLYDASELALQDLQILVFSGRNSDLLYKWAKSEDYKRNKKWQGKLVEALAIIQNYRVLKGIGFNKVDLNTQYMPHRPETSCLVNKTRKAFYLIAEKLTTTPTLQFIQNMERKLRETGTAVRTFGDPYYLEMYFLYWELNHLSIEDIKCAFKVMGLEESYDILNSVKPSEMPEEPIHAHFETKSSPKETSKHKVRRRSTTRDTTYPQPRSAEDLRTSQSGISTNFQEGSSNDIFGYSIDQNNPGIVLIINQEDFYTELNPQYQNLLHDDNYKIKLETREGTMMDKEKLAKVFERLGFRIIIKDNLPHDDLINTIRDVVMMISSESSLIVCVLSHGDNGVVYGANSCKVDVHLIQNIMCKRNRKLRGKPKVLILQSCQGKQCQKIEEEYEEEENANAMDGPSYIPSTADLLTFWATIPGYAAIRNKNKGSWLIQELCDEINQLSPRYHFLDICTRVVEKVTNKAWKEETSTNIMTPMVVTTLRKPFYLPASKKK